MQIKEVIVDGMAIKMVKALTDILFSEIMNSQPIVSDQKRQTRLNWIFSQLVAGREVTVDKIHEHCKVSDRTARADIANFLSLQNAWERTPGGVGRRIRKPNCYADKAWSEHIDAKQDVAIDAALVVTPGCSLSASPGSTVALTVGALNSEGIGCSIVTNSLALIDYATSPDAQVYYVAGQYSQNIHGMLGLDAVKGFEDRPCHAGLVGVSGCSLNQAGQCVLRVKHDAEVPVIRTMLQHVQELIVVVFNVHKLGVCDPWQIGTLNELAATDRGGSRRIVVVTNEFSHWEEEFKTKNEREAALKTFDKLDELDRNGTIKLVRAPKSNR
jgi:DeoR/GlpR family transcriptional regulator of sugar metabolism